MPGCYTGCFNEKCLFCVPLPNGCCLIVWYHMIMSLIGALTCVEEFRNAALEGRFPILLVNSSIALPFHASAALIEFTLAFLLIVGFIGNSPLFLLLYMSMVLVWAGTLLAVAGAQVSGELPGSENVTPLRQGLIFISFAFIAVSYMYFAWIAVKLQKYVRRARALRDEEMRQFVADLSDRRRHARMARTQAPTRKSTQHWDLEARTLLSQPSSVARRSSSHPDRHSAVEVEIPPHILFISETGTRASDSFSEESLTSAFSRTSLREGMARNSANKDTKESSIEFDKSSKIQDGAKPKRRLDEAGTSTDQSAQEPHITLENLKTQDVHGSSARAPSRISSGSRRGSVECDLKAQELGLLEEALQMTRGGEPMSALPEVEEDRRSQRPTEEPPEARAPPTAFSTDAIGSRSGGAAPRAEGRQKWPLSQQPTRVHTPSSGRSLVTFADNPRDQTPKGESVHWAKSTATERTKADVKKAEIEKPKVSEAAEKHKTPKMMKGEKTFKSPRETKTEKKEDHSDSELKVIMSAMPSSQSHGSTDVSGLWRESTSTPDKTDTTESDTDPKSVPNHPEETPVAIHSWPWRESQNERIKSLSKERELQKTTSLHQVPGEVPKTEMDTWSLGQLSEIKSQKSLKRWNSEEERMQSLRKLMKKAHEDPQKTMESKSPRVEVGEASKSMNEEKRVPDIVVTESEDVPEPSRPRTDGAKKSSETPRKRKLPTQEESGPAGLSSTAAKSKATTRKSEAAAAPRAAKHKKVTKQKPRPPRRKPAYPRRSETDSDSGSSLPISSSSSFFSSSSSSILSESSTCMEENKGKGKQKSR